MADRGDNEVGYGRPPRHSRFKKGQSGNPGGRPKAVNTIAQALGAALDDTVSMKVKGKRKRLTVREVIAKRLVHKAAEGDVQALRMIQKYEEMTKPAAGPDAGVDEFPQYEIELQLEEAPIRLPDFITVAYIQVAQYGDAIPEHIREKIQRMVQLRDEILADDHLFPVSLKELTE